MNTAYASVNRINSNEEISVTDYMNDMGKIRVMEAQEEFQLFRNIDKLGQSCVSYLLTSPFLLQSVRKFLPKMNGKDEPDRIAEDILRQIEQRAEKSRLVTKKLIQGVYNISRTSDRCRAWMHHLEIISTCDEDGTELTTEWCKELRRRRNKLTQAKNNFAKLNLRLVIRVAKTYQWLATSLSFADLIQEGNIGLMRAVDKFDVSRGYRFSTYSSWWIRQQIHRAITNKDRPVRIPVHVSDLVHKYAKLEQKYMNHIGRLPTPEEATKQMGVPPAKMEILAAVKHAPILPLDAPIADGEGHEVTYLEMLTDEKAQSQFDKVCLNKLSKDLIHTMAVLTPQERDIISQRFGLDHSGSRTLAEIAVGYDLSRERIRQLEAQAIKKMKKHPNFLKDYI